MHPRQNYGYAYEIGVAESNGDVRILITSLDAHAQYKFGNAKTAQDDRCEVERPSSCNAFATATFSSLVLIISRIFDLDV